jgi:hypothetical protein
MNALNHEAAKPVFILVKGFGMNSKFTFILGLLALPSGQTECPILFSSVID